MNALDIDIDTLVQQFRGHPFRFDQTIEEKRRDLDLLAGRFQPPSSVETNAVSLAGMTTERHVAHAADARSCPVLYYLHGGGYVTGSPTSHRHLCAKLAELTGAVCYAPDYRLAPEHPFPAAVDDAFNGYQNLVQRYGANRLAMVGDSAGAGLTFAAALRARELNVRTPSCLVALSPWVNHQTDGISYDLIGPLDPLLCRSSVNWYSEQYLKEGPRDAHEASPLFANLNDLPPTLIQTGDHEVFFGDAVDMHQRLLAAGVSSQLSVWNRMIHVWHLFWPILPQGREALGEASAYIRQFVNPDHSSE